MGTSERNQCPKSFKFVLSFYKIKLNLSSANVSEFAPSTFHPKYIFTQSDSDYKTYQDSVAICERHTSSLSGSCVEQRSLARGSHSNSNSAAVSIPPCNQSTATVVIPAELLTSILLLSFHKYFIIRNKESNLCFLRLRQLLTCKHWGCLALSQKGWYSASSRERQCVSGPRNSSVWGSLGTDLEADVLDSLADTGSSPVYNMIKHSILIWEIWIHKLKF